MGEMQGIKKEDLNRIIHLFGERRKSRFGCEDYYTLCGYRREDGVLVHYDGTLLSSRNLDIPEKLTDFSLVTGMWPIEPKLLASAEEFFTHLAGGGQSSIDQLLIGAVERAQCGPWGKRRGASKIAGSSLHQ